MTAFNRACGKKPERKDVFTKTSLVMQFEIFLKMCDGKMKKI